MDDLRPTVGIQEIALTPFTVNQIYKFTKMDGDEILVIQTDEEFKCEYEINGEKKTGEVNRFFASPVEIKKFFGDASVMKDVNENRNKIRTMIEKIPFTAEEISRKESLKGKTHYVFKKI